MEVAGNAPTVKHPVVVAEEIKMTIEQITDTNYNNFKNYPRAVLLVSVSWCQPCKAYEPILDTLSNQMPYIKFGKTTLDKDRSSQLKREYLDINSWAFPTTLLFKDKREMSRIKGISSYPDILSKIKNNLLLETKAYLASDGKFIPAIVDNVQDNNRYRLRLMENSLLGQKDNLIEIEKEKILWNLGDI
jgi:thiol-disulfide isomerase/thioredoxin